MANPRQRSKARSHKSTKPSLNQKKRLNQKLKRAPTLRGPEVLQKSWDKKKTVFQNYAELGLLPKIPLPNRSSSKSYKTSLPFLPPHLRSAQGMTEEPVEDEEIQQEPKPKSTFGKIIRDEEGNVIDIIIEEAEPEAEEEEDEEDMEKDLPNVEGKTEVVKSLEQLASTAVPVQRHSSASEKTWLKEMVLKYDDDYEKMSRDMKLNVWQKTSGEIKRMIKTAGGVEKLKRVI